MTATIKQTEATPSAYPDPPAGLSAAAATLNPAVVWQRLEHYCAFRWGERSVTWIVEGPGEWIPPLAPATVGTVEVWRDEWEMAEVSASPSGGYVLPGCGPYRFVATVGTAAEDGAPAAVLEAWRRLAEYMIAKPGKPGATSERITAGSVGIAHNRSASWLAQAVENSGAGDLLRAYRRAA